MSSYNGVEGLPLVPVKVSIEAPEELAELAMEVDVPEAGEAPELDFLALGRKELVRYTIVGSLAPPYRGPAKPEEAMPARADLVEPLELRHVTLVTLLDLAPIDHAGHVRQVGRL